LWYNYNEEINEPFDSFKWSISTLGTINPDEWVPDLFWKLLKREKLLSLDSNVTYLFELCCKKNMVVTSYNQDKLFLIGARETQSGRHFSFEELDKLAPVIETRRPKYFTFKQLGINNLKRTKQWVEDQSLLSDYGTNPEGFVIYLNNIPLCKLKNVSYVQKHGIVTGDLLYVRNIVTDRFFAETLDDVWDVIKQPVILAFLSELKGKVNDMIAEIETIRNELLPKITSTMDQKSYVKVIQENVLVVQYRTFFLQVF